MRQMLKRYSIGVVASFILAGPAYAATDLCPLLAAGSYIQFAEMKVAFDQTPGCSSKTQVSALFKVYQCGTDTIRIDDAQGGPIIIVASDPPLSSINLKCTADRKFVSSNVLVTDQAVIKGGYTATVLRGASSIMVVTRSYAHQEDLVDVSKWFFSVSVPAHSFEMTKVLIADVDLTSSDLDTLIKALHDRGSRVLSEGPSGQLTGHIVLSEPVGLEGVSQVTVNSVNRHILTVEYTIPNDTDYKAFVALLDGKYGRSSRFNLDKCISRQWTSGSVGILGSFCAGSASSILFVNRGAAAEYTQLLDAYERDSKVNDGAKVIRSKHVDHDNY